MGVGRKLSSLSLLVALLFLAGCGKETPFPSTSTPTPKPTPAPTESPETFKASARTDLSYDELTRKTESYIGQRVYYRGKVVQVTEVSTQRVVLRVNIAESSFGLWEDTVWVNWEGLRVLEDDIISFWGTIQGRREYRALLGNQVVIPEITAKYLEIEKKAGETNIPTVTPTPTPALTATATPTAPPPGYTRLNPAPIGTALALRVQSWSVERGGFDYEVRVTLQEIIRGEEAWNRILAVNQFNDPPPAGFEYVLAKIRFEYLKGPSPEISYHLSAMFEFDTISSEGKQYEVVSVLLPDPELRATLYPGAWHEGWAAFMVAQVDAKPLLTFGRNSDGTGGIWFKLY